MKHFSLSFPFAIEYCRLCQYSMPASPFFSVIFNMGGQSLQGDLKLLLNPILIRFISKSQDLSLTLCL